MNHNHNPWNEIARQCGIPQDGFALQQRACMNPTQAHLANMQQASNARMHGLLNALSNKPEPKLARARRIAAEVRARKPEMQVRKLTGGMP